jgi:protein-disulfide isomerase
MPTVEDPFGTIATGLGLQGTPTTIFLDANHREVGRVVGAMDQDGLEDAIDQLVGA